MTDEPYNREDRRAQMPRKELSLRQALTLGAGMLTVLVPCAIAITKWSTTSDQAAQVPAILLAVQQLQTSATTSVGDIQMLKDRRNEDSNNTRDMRNEIMKKLDAIDNKLESKADKMPVGLRAFTK